VADSLKLYVKTWCPWCVSAKRTLDSRGYVYEEIDVEADEQAYRDMIRLSGQHLTPTLVVGERVLPDFGTPELMAFLKYHKIEP
jgi:glutaredoxin